MPAAVSSQRLRHRVGALQPIRSTPPRLSPFSRGTSPTNSSPCFASSTRCRRAITCSRFRTCRTSTGRRVPGCFRSSSRAADIVAGGKCMFDSEGNLWVGDNFTVGWQGQDSLWQGHATKFAPNGKAALADHHGLHGRRNGRGHFRRCGRLPMTMRGSPAMAARPFRYSTRTASL